MTQSHMAIVGIIIVLSLMVLFGMEQDRQEWCEKRPTATSCKAAQQGISRTSYRAVPLF